MMQKHVLIALAGVGAWSVATMGTIVPTAAYAETFSKAVGEPLKAAKTAMEKRQWDSALDQHQESPGRRRRRNRTRNTRSTKCSLRAGPAEGQPGAARVYEQNLNSGRMPPSRSTSASRSSRRCTSAARNWPKAIEYGNRWIKAYPNDAEAYFQLAQAQHQMKEYKSAAKTMQPASKWRASRGKTPEGELAEPEARLPAK